MKLNENRPHIGTKCSLKTHVNNLGYPLVSPHTNRGFKNHLYSTTSKLNRVKVHDINAGRRDSFRLLQSVLMNVIGLYVSCKFGGNVKLLMYDEL